MGAPLGVTLGAILDAKKYINQDEMVGEKLDEKEDVKQDDILGTNMDAKNM